MGRERLARYSLAGPENQAAVDAGLAGGDWFRSEVPRKRMKELMRRSDYPAIRDTAIWFGLMVLFAGLGIAFWGSWWAVPFFLAYGVLYGSTSDSRWHETGHGTAFKTRWLDRGPVPARVLHDHARPDGVAVEPHPAPHRHPDPRPGPGDRGDAPGAAGEAAG